MIPGKTSAVLCECGQPENSIHHSSAAAKSVDAHEFRPAKTTAVGDGRNPHGYERGFTIEQHRDELIERLGSAIKRIAELEAQLRQEREAREKIGEHLLTAIQQRDEATVRHIASDESAYQLQAQVSQLQTTVGQLTGALNQVDWLAQMGIDGNGKRVYDSQNEMKIIEVCQKAPGTTTKGRRFFEPDVDAALATCPAP